MNAYNIHGTFLQGKAPFSSKVERERKKNGIIALLLIKMMREKIEDLFQ